MVPHHRTHTVSFFQKPCLAPFLSLDKSLSSAGQLHCITDASVPSQSIAFSLAWYSVKAAFCSSVLALAGIPRMAGLRVETTLKVVDLVGNPTIS